MPECKNCKQQVSSNLNFCPNCGTATESNKGGTAIVQCGRCQGKGRDPDISGPCKTCGGKGKVRV